VPLHWVDVDSITLLDDKIDLWEVNDHNETSELASINQF